jgi:peptide/nickel transport system substrate-binding protein
VKKSIIVLLAVLVIASLSLVACSSPATSPATTAPVSKPPATTSVPPAATTTAAVPTASATAKPASPSASATAPAQSASPTASGPAPQSGGTLRVILFGTPLFIGDPTLFTDSNSNMTAIPDLEALVFSDNSGQFRGVLATDWKVAQDGKSVTFNLRKGVKFHDGTDFNAAAAKWNMDRFMAAQPGTVPQWSSIDVVDDYTIKLNLKAFQNTILNALEGGAGMMVSPTAAQKNGLDWMKSNEAGTGPFTLKSFSRDVSVQFTRFDGYWGAKPYLDGVTFNVIADPNTARLAFEGGQNDVFSSPVDSVTADLVKKGYILEYRPGPLMSLVPDSKHDTSPFAKLEVRQAVSYAIDREGMAKTLGFGFWEVTYQPNAAYQFGHIDPAQVPYKYDPAKAKQLLAAAGYPNGFSTQIITASSFAKDPILAMQASLKEAGINVNINTVEFAAWNNFVTKGWDNGLIWVTQGATDTNYGAYLDRYFSSTATRYPVLNKPAALTDLITKVAATPDYATEKSLAQQAVKILVDDCTTIPVFIQPANYVLQKNVHDTRFSNLGGSGFRWSPQTAWLSK